MSVESDRAPLIQVRGVSKAFLVDGQPRSVFSDVSFDIPRGQFLTLIGASGCGKSTLLRIIAGLQPASSGTVLLGGQTVVQPPPGLIYVFQQYANSVFPWRTVEQNMRFGLEIRGMDRGETQRRVQRVLSLVGLEGFMHHYPSQLSGGMQQRLALGRALVCEPDVILMDEPFSAVDALTRMNLQQQLLEIWETMRTTIVFVTHDVEEAVLLSERVICLGGKPASIRVDLPIEIPHPRSAVSTKEHPSFLPYRHQLLETIFAEEGSGGSLGSRPVAPSRTPRGS